MSMNEAVLAAPRVAVATARPATPDALDAPNALDTGIGHALDALLAQQNADGHWVYELEADATIPAEYVLMVHYLARRRT